MTKARLTLRDLLVSAAYFLWFYAVTGFITFLAYRDMTYVHAQLWLVFPFTLLWLFRRFVKKILPYLLLHAVMLAAVYLLPKFTPAKGFIISLGGLDFNLFIFFGILFMLAACGFFLRTRFTGRTPVYETSLAIFFCLTLAALCVACEYFAYSELARMLTTIVVLLLVLLYVFGQMFNMDYSLGIITTTSTQPVSAILSFNNKLILIFAGFLTITAVITGFFGLDGGLLILFLFLWRGLRSVLRFLFGLLGSGEEPEQPYIPAEQPAVDDDMFLFEMLEDKPTPLFWQILQEIVVYAALIAFSAAVLAGIVYGCYRLYKMFYSARDNMSGDITESILPDMKAAVWSRFAFSPGGPANRTRRLFYRKVRKYRQKNNVPDQAKIQLSDTSWEMAKKIKASEDIDALTEKYQQARYG